MRAGGHRLRAGIAAAGIAAAGHGLRAGTLPGRAAHIGRPSACPLRQRCSRFPDTPSSCPASKGRAVVARRPSTRSLGGPRSLRRVGSLRAFVLSSSNVPSWVVARPFVVGSIQVAFRRRLKFRPFGPSRPQAASGPRKRGTLRPIPPPFPAREGGEGSRIRCGGDPLRRDGGFSHRTADFYWTDTYRTANRTRSAHKGVSAASRIHHPRTGGGASGRRKTLRRSCRRPGGSPAANRRRRTHAQEGARGRGTRGRGTRGVRGVGWVVGAGARRAGRPGSRRGRKAPGRLPGRLLLWASAPPRLTSCRQCGKIPHEGSHRRRSQRRPSSMVRQKPGRFRNDRALLYLGHHPRDYRRIKCA